MNDTVKCPKHTTGGGPCYCNAVGKSDVERVVMPDYCFLCGGAVEPDKWRVHMKHHNIVLTENPKTSDGRWKDAI